MHPIWTLENYLVRDKTIVADQEHQLENPHKILQSLRSEFLRTEATHFDK